MFERLISSGYTLGPVQFETNVPYSKKQLVVFSSPAPEVVRHSVHFFEILNESKLIFLTVLIYSYVMRKHEDATDVVGVVILRMQFWRSDMNRAVFREFVFYLMSLRNQVDIVHRNVVNLYFCYLFIKLLTYLCIKCIQESCIYKRSTVKSITIDLIDNNYLMSYIGFAKL